MGLSYTLELADYDLKDRLNEHLPFEYTKFFTTVRIDNVDIFFKADSNRVHLSATIEVVTPAGLKGKGLAEISGGVRYDKAQGAFFIDELNVEKIKVAFVPAMLMAQVEALLGMALGIWLSRYPVFTLNEKNKKQRFAKNVLQSMKVKGGVLHLTLKAFLTSSSFYNFCRFTYWHMANIFTFHHKDNMLRDITCMVTYAVQALLTPTLRFEFV